MSKCRSCGAEIEWVELVSGKMHPVDPKLMFGEECKAGAVLVTDDGEVMKVTVDNAFQVSGKVSHFASCPESDLWRKPSAAKKQIADKAKKEGWL